MSFWLRDSEFCDHSLGFRFQINLLGSLKVILLDKKLMQFLFDLFTMKVNGIQEFLCGNYNNILSTIKLSANVEYRF